MRRKLSSLQEVPLASAALGIKVDSIYRGDIGADSLFTYIWSGCDVGKAVLALDRLEGRARVFRVQFSWVENVTRIYWALLGGSVAVSGEPAFIVIQEEQEFYAKRGLL